MPRSLRQLIGDIESAARRAQVSVDGLSRSQVLASEDKRDAVCYQLVIVGEAAKRLPVPFVFRHPEIPWRQTSAMRNRLVHSYFKIDYGIVWDTVQNDVPSSLLFINSLHPAELT